MYSDNYHEYYHHLNKTSKLGDIYRNFFLFPFLKKNLRGKCIDIGCGLGKFVKSRSNTDAADINEICVNNLKKLGYQTYLIKNNKISVIDSTYESLLLDNVIEHINNPNYLLTECKRILKNDGIIIIGTPGLKGYNSQQDHKVYYDEEKLIKLMLSLNFIHLKTYFKPIKLNLLDKLLKQYCMYSIFINKKN